MTQMFKDDDWIPDVEAAREAAEADTRRTLGLRHDAPIPSDALSPTSESPSRGAKHGHPRCWWCGLEARLEVNGALVPALYCSMRCQDAAEGAEGSAGFDGVFGPLVRLSRAADAMGVEHLSIGVSDAAHSLLCGLPGARPRKFFYVHPDGAYVIEQCEVTVAGVRISAQATSRGPTDEEVALAKHSSHISHCVQGTSCDITGRY